MELLTVIGTTLDVQVGVASFVPDARVTVLEVDVVAEDISVVHLGQVFVETG